MNQYSNQFLAEVGAQTPGVSDLRNEVAMLEENVQTFRTEAFNAHVVGDSDRAGMYMGLHEEADQRADEATYEADENEAYFINEKIDDGVTLRAYHERKHIEQYPNKLNYEQPFESKIGSLALDLYRITAAKPDFTLIDSKNIFRKMHISKEVKKPNTDESSQILHKSSISDAKILKIKNLSLENDPKTHYDKYDS